jgi:predicted nucleotidyltransferase
VIKAPSRQLSSQRIEAISRDDFSGRLNRIGWKAVPVSRDDGEDFLVEVRPADRPTGVNFYVQLKSDFDLSRAPRAGAVGCSVKVKHLLRWEKSGLPVVLVVWDNQRHEGRWALVSELISRLDQATPAWRDKSPTQTQRVHIPWGNVTDDSGLQRLGRVITTMQLPLLLRGRTLDAEFLLSFPDDQDGRAAFTQYQRMLDNGEPARLPGNCVADVRFPDVVHDLLMGDGDFSRSLLVLMPPIVGSTVLVDVEMIPTTGDPVGPCRLAMRVVRYGEQGLEITNDDTMGPLTATIALAPRAGECHLSLSARVLGNDAHRALLALRFLKAVSSGGTLRISLPSLDINERLPVAGDPRWAPDADLMHFVENVACLAAGFGADMILPPNGVTVDDQREVARWAEVLRKGRSVERHASGTIKAHLTDLAAIEDYAHPGARLFLQEASKDVVASVLGTRLAVGRETMYLSGLVRSVEATPDRSRSTELSVAVTDIEERRLYPDVLEREANRLAKLLTDRYGATEVYLFGSLAWSDALEIEADIDLAVCGIESNRFIEVATRIDGETTFALDLVDLDMVPTRLRQRILVEGRRLDGGGVTSQVGG